MLLSALSASLWLCACPPAVVLHHGLRWIWPAMNGAPPFEQLFQSSQLEKKWYIGLTADEAWSKVCARDRLVVFLLFS